MSLDNAFWAAANLTEPAVIGLLIYRRIWRKLPVFFVYSIWALVSDLGTYAFRLISPAGYNIHFYFGVSVVDFAMQFAVLVEVAWSVLLPLRSSLSRRALVWVALVILAAGAAIWPFAGIAGFAHLSKAWRDVIQLQQTASILRVLFFLVLAGCSHLLSIGWRDRELQVATGFGFYSLVSLAVAALNTRQATAMEFDHLYRLVAISFLCSLAYWVFSFAQKDAERREFNPEMQHVLLVLARAAHSTRVELKGGATEAAGAGDGSC